MDNSNIGDTVRPLTRADLPDCSACCDEALVIGPDCDCRDVLVTALYREGVLSLVCDCCDAAVTIQVAGAAPERN